MRKRKFGYRRRARLDPQIWSYFVDFFCRIGRKVETIRFTSLLGSSHFNEHLGRRSFVQRETTIRIQISGTWFIIIETQLRLTGFSFSKRPFWNSASSVNLPRRVQHCFLAYVLYLLFIFSYSKGLWPPAPIVYVLLDTWIPFKGAKEQRSNGRRRRRQRNKGETTVNLTTNWCVEKARI